MKIWVEHDAARPTPAQAGQAGWWIRQPGGAVPRDALPWLATLGVEKDTEELAREAEALLVPAGMGAHPALLEAAAEAKRAILLCVNGLGAAALGASLECLRGADVALTYDARDVHLEPLLTQLAWLRASRAPFAVIATDPQALLVSAAFAPEALVVPAPCAIDPSRLSHFGQVHTAGGARPLHSSELDALPPGEASLTVTRDLAGGAFLVQGDLAVAVTEERGISPHLATRVSGRRLRYPIRCGEPLTFGHLSEP